MQRYFNISLPITVCKSLLEFFEKKERTNIQKHSGRIIDSGGIMDNGGGEIPPPPDGGSAPTSSSQSEEKLSKSAILGIFAPSKTHFAPLDAPQKFTGLVPPLIIHV